MKKTLRSRVIQANRNKSTVRARVIDVAINRATVRLGMNGPRLTMIPTVVSVAVGNTVLVDYTGTVPLVKAVI